MKSYHVFLIALLFSAIAAFAFTKRSGETTKPVSAGFALVELYTSEGCSSCPPADKLLAKIQQEYKDKEVYVLAYHVDYWDRLGWKDVFSNPAYSARQRAYSAYLNVDGVYTPQAIVNGKTEFVGSDDAKMHTAITQSLAKASTTALDFSNIKVDHNKATVEYRVSGSIQINNLLLAVIQKHAITKVQNGENKGRALPHINIVHQLQSINLKSNSGNAGIDLPAGFNAKDWGIVGFIQNTRNGEILAAQKVIFDTKELSAAN